jgi:predicted SnoaL-like aldol condensation-catalyzing enzyme
MRGAVAIGPEDPIHDPSSTADWTRGPDEHRGRGRLPPLAAAGRAREAFDRYGSGSFRHHNPGFTGDGSSLAAAIDEDHARHPRQELTVVRTIAEGPYVAVHSRLLRGDGDTPGYATVHIFRVEDGKVEELWDIAQEIPAESPNQFGMF